MTTPQAENAPGYGLGDYEYTARGMRKRIVKLQYPGIFCNAVQYFVVPTVRALPFALHEPKNEALQQRNRETLTLLPYFVTPA